MEAIRQSGLMQHPVVSNGRLVGVVTESAVLDALVAGDPRTVSESAVGTIMNHDVACGDPHMTIAQSAEVMSRYQLQSMPLANEYGFYMGTVCRADIVGALSLTIRPPVIAGMATPIGVYLTTGQLRAGAGDIGLILTGVSMMLLNLIAIGIVYGIASLLQAEIPSFQILSALVSPSIHQGYWMDIAGKVMLGAAVPIFLLLLRLVPLSGYHGAEHQVVHTIENGEQLTEANVRAMPRVHPRCGTNIVAAVILFSLVAQVFSEQVAAMIAVLLFVVAGRRIGGFFQQYVTTRPASEKQILSGIKAGESLLEQYRLTPGYSAAWWRRIWNTGFPQVVVGSVATAELVHLLRILPSGLF
jgi:CBS domain-containing protein